MRRKIKFYFDAEIALALVPLLYMVLFALMIIICLTGCSSGKTVILPEVRQTVVHERDTVWRSDSIKESCTTIIQEADSALLAEFGIRLNNMEHAWLVRQSTARESKGNITFINHKDSIVHDSIPVPYPQTVYKDKEISVWQKIMMQLGYGFFGIIIGAIVLALWKYKK